MVQEIKNKQSIQTCMHYQTYNSEEQTLRVFLINIVNSFNVSKLFFEFYDVWGDKIVSMHVQFKYIKYLR